MAMLSVALPVFLPWPPLLRKIQLKGSMQKKNWNKKTNKNKQTKTKNPRSTQAGVQKKDMKATSKNVFSNL